MRVSRAVSAVLAGAGAALALSVAAVAAPTATPSRLVACFGNKGVEFGDFSAWLCEVKLGSDPSGALYFTPSVDNGLNDVNPSGQMVWYKLHAAVCVQTGLPLAWQVETAKDSESLFVAPLLDAVQARGYNPHTCAMDKGYDHERIHGECESRGVHPVVPIRVHHERMGKPNAPLGTRHNPHISRYGNDFRNLYYRRSAVEREFGRLKHDYALAPLRVRGLQRVRLHADLVMLARLSLALERARAVPLAA